MRLDILMDVETMPATWYEHLKTVDEQLINILIYFDLRPLETNAEKKDFIY